jgi:hypothetical protein
MALKLVWRPPLGIEPTVLSEPDFECGGAKRAVELMRLEETEAVRAARGGVPAWFNGAL